MLNIYAVTNGCVEGQLSTKQIERFFKTNEFALVKTPEKADLVVFYACGLTEQDEKNSLETIKNIKSKMKSSAKLVVWGCLPKINPQSLKDIYDGRLIGSLERNFFEEIPNKITVPLDDINCSADADELNSIAVPKQSAYKQVDPITTAIILFKQGLDKIRTTIVMNPSIYYVKIGTGCMGKCTYCSEHPVFGKPKSRSVDEIISEFKKGLQEGYNRFSLIATDTGSYGMDIGYTLPKLLRKIMEANDKKDFKIIINQLELLHLSEICADMDDIFSSGKIEKLECPVQSGSNRILELMNRGYTAEEWRTRMIQINQKYPKIRLGTHFMIGFPTETEEDFNATLQLLNPPLFLDFIYAIGYSNRPRVRASSMSDQISETTKELRYKKLKQKYAQMYVCHFMKLRQSAFLL